MYIDIRILESVESWDLAAKLEPGKYQFAYFTCGIIPGKACLGPPMMLHEGCTYVGVFALLEYGELSFRMITRVGPLFIHGE
jgi:hypothetical protein